MQTILLAALIVIQVLAWKYPTKPKEPGIFDVGGFTS